MVLIANFPDRDNGN